MDAIKPCGHCGQEAIFFNEFKDAGRVVCTGCGCSTPTASAESAIRTWNRRHVDECHPILEMWLDGVGADAYCSECRQYWGEHESAEALASMLSDYCPDCGSRIDWEHPERVM